MKHLLVPMFVFSAFGVYALVGCADDQASSSDASAVDASSNPGSDAAVTDANPCPEGQVLVDALCVTPTTSGSPFLCTIPPVAACGGDLVGTWKYIDSCENDPNYNIYASSCGDDANVTHFYYTEYEGTLSFYEGGTYGDSYIPTNYSVSNMPMSCGGYYDCSRLATSWGLGTCTLVGDRCECAKDATPGDSENSGDSYTLAGNEVTFLGDSMGSPYCIQGDILYLDRVVGSTYEPLMLERQ
jgi:hypothetical protein